MITEKFEEFFLQRNEDESGVSGTGIVARGVVFPSGKAVLEWLSFHSSVNIYPNLEAINHIHGHGGKTVVIMGKPPHELVRDHNEPWASHEKLTKGKPKKPKPRTAKHES
jgi:hypothetical protein